MTFGNDDCSGPLENERGLEGDRLGPVWGRDRHARKRRARLPGQPVERPIAATGILVSRLSHPLLARSLPLGLGGGIRSSRPVHPGGAGSRGCSSRETVYEEGASNVS